MEALGQASFAVVGISLLGGIILTLLPQGSAREYLRITLGIVMLFAFISRVWSFDWHTIADALSFSVSSGAPISAQGEEMAAEAMASIISDQCEAYVMDKAREMGVDIWIEVSVGKDLLPISAQISGTVTPEQQKEIEVILEQSLAIPKEAQYWNG